MLVPGTVLAALVLYLASLAPGLTWAHQGADGGELLAAAMTNGVPHPPGYPLYIPLLQFWLTLAGMLTPGSDLAWRGNLFSALCAALSVGVTTATARHLLHGWSGAWLWAALAGMAWAVCPLLWTQAVITEVYALHALLTALLGWVVLVRPRRWWDLTVVIALGVAHHLTFVLLLPAAAYIVWTQTPGERRRLRRLLGSFAAGILLGALVYLRIPLVAGSGPPPVNWGYADNLEGFWWLVSGAAYRGYLFAADMGSTPARIAAWAYTVTTQFTPVGMAVALGGLAHWDRVRPALRNFSLLWLTPISIYSIAYHTRDSDIYLLAVAWMMALWIAVGLAVLAKWLSLRLAPRRHADMALAALVAVALCAVAVWRWPEVALTDDATAREYLAAVGQVLEPESIVVTLEDRETFAIWYGAWGSGELAAKAPGLIPVNESLFQFDWYRRLQKDLYPTLPGVHQSAPALVAGGRDGRPVYFAQLPVEYAQERIEAIGPLWRLKE